MTPDRVILSLSIYTVSLYVPGITLITAPGLACLTASWIDSPSFTTISSPLVGVSRLRTVAAGAEATSSAPAELNFSLGSAGTLMTVGAGCFDWPR